MAGFAMLAAVEGAFASGNAIQDVDEMIHSLPSSLHPALEKLQRKDSDDFRSGIVSALGFASWRGNVQAPSAQRLVDALVDVASNHKETEGIRWQAVRLLDEDGDAPIRRASLPGLRWNLRASDPRLRRSAAHLLMIQGDAVMLEALLSQCRRVLQASPGHKDAYAKSVECLDPLARAGPDARSAVPMLKARLPTVDVATRNEVVETLGYLGDRSVVPLLVEGLKSDDVGTVASSLVSLWRLRTKDRLPEVRAVARSHWYEPIRALADRIAKGLEGGPAAAIEDRLRPSIPGSLTTGSMLSLARYSNAPHPRCGSWKVGGQDFDLSGEEDRGYAAKRNAFAERFGKGMLVGTHWGEWGGGLHFVGDNGRAIRLVGSNVAGLQRSYAAKEFIAFLGLAHLSDPGGEVVRVGFRGGMPRVMGRRRLPSAPERVYRDFRYPTSLVVMASREAVLVADEDLSFKQATCTHALPEEKH